MVVLTNMNDTNTTLKESTYGIPGEDYNETVNATPSVVANSVDGEATLVTEEELLNLLLLVDFLPEAAQLELAEALEAEGLPAIDAPGLTVGDVLKVVSVVSYVIIDQNERDLTDEELLANDVIELTDFAA